MHNKYWIFFKKAGILLLLMVALDIGIGKLLEHYFFNMKSGETARITYGMTQAREEALIFGSSTANHHYIPSILNDSLHLSTYNLGIDGEGILFHYCLLKNILQRTSPGIILLNIDIDEFEESVNRYDKLNVLLPYYQLNKDIQPVINLRRRFEKFKAFSNLYRYNSYILPILLNNLIHRQDSSRSGYLPLNQTNSPVPLSNQGEDVSNLDSIRIKYFHLFIQEAKKSGSRVVVLISPIYRANRNIISKTISLASNICESENVPFINNVDLEPFNDHPEYFRDPFHLIHSGAQLYTKYIASLMVRDLGL